uniref:Uncharacterized protein n=1 Tax=Hordeum vulgare subsp. vulgare TaxID=112509 RepID=A0A8I6Y541_HORVV
MASKAVGMRRRSRGSERLLRTEAIAATRGRQPPNVIGTPQHQPNISPPRARGPHFCICTGRQRKHRRTPSPLYKPPASLRSPLLLLPTTPPLRRIPIPTDVQSSPAQRDPHRGLRQRPTTTAQLRRTAADSAISECRWSIRRAGLR